MTGEVVFRVRHKKVSTATNSDDATLIQPSDWNDEHEFVGELPAGPAGQKGDPGPPGPKGDPGAPGAVGDGLNPGFVAYFAGAAAPSGWLEANGALVSRATYAALFAAIGTLYGAGNGSTTFALPDLRGEFIRGWDDGRGIDSGRVIGSAQAHGLSDHSHTLSNVASSGSYGSVQISTSTPAAPGGFSTGGAQGSVANETRPRNVALLACIKV